MNHPPFAPPSDASDDLGSISEVEGTSSWDTGSEGSNEDSNEGELDWSLDRGCADEAFWKEDTVAGAWLDKFPGGTPFLYPHLFVVKQRGGEILTPCRYPNKDSLFHLPPEIRNQIYKHYFDSDEETKRSQESHASFRDREGIEMQRIYLNSENVELKFWLSAALLQTSRQMRFEAMSVFFSTRMFTVDWPPSLPRFVDFLGEGGSAMVRYLDALDTLNLQGENNAKYRSIITSIMHFSDLQHLRIVVSLGIRNSGSFWKRYYSWFGQNKWKHDGTLTKQAVPKMQPEDIERHWPEYEVLKDLRAQKFTLAVETPWADRYLEFDRGYGAYPGIVQSVESHAARAPSSANLATSSISPQALGGFETIGIQTLNSALTPSIGFGDEDSDDSPTWQKTDTLANRIIPL